MTVPDDPTANPPPPIPDPSRGFYYRKRAKKTATTRRQKLNRFRLAAAIGVLVFFAILIGVRTVWVMDREFDKRLADQTARLVMFYVSTHDGSFPQSLPQLSSVFPSWAATYRKEFPFARPDFSLIQQRIQIDFTQFPSSIKEFDPSKPESDIRGIALKSDPSLVLHAARHSFWLMMKQEHDDPGVLGRSMPELKGSEPASTRPASQPR